MRFATLLLASSLCAAQPTLTSATLPLAHGGLEWSAGTGLTVRYHGRAVFTPYSAELVVHDQGWTQNVYNSRSQPATGVLSHNGDVTTLTVTYTNPQMPVTEILTAGPGDTFSVEWHYRQDAWDNVHLQLGFSRPEEGFFNGSRFIAHNPAGAESTGVVPAVYERSRLFENAVEATVESIFGRLVVRTSKPVWLQDYQEPGTLWLGLDEPLPRGEDMTFRLDAELQPGRIEAGGLVLSELTVPEQVEDGRLRAGLSLARAPDGPAAATVKVELAHEGAEPLTAGVDVDCGADPKPALAVVATPEAGAYQATLSVSAGGQEVWHSPALPLRVVAPFAVMAGRLPYTSEARGELLVTVRPAVSAAGLRLVAEGGPARIESTPVPGQRTVVPFDLAALPNGSTPLTCRLMSGQELLATHTVAILKAPPKPGTVAVDYSSGGLIVDGLPVFPFGFYCFYPPDEVAVQEAPAGWTHAMPYRRDAGYTEGDEAKAQVLAVLDRCAAVGVRVHYDLRKLCTAEDTPEKWDRLRSEVELVRDHPALLCWYLADEPELSHIPPELMAKAYRFVKELDPYHPCTMVFANRSLAPDYAAGMDIVMTDPYPIPHGSVTAVSQATDLMVDSIGPSLPLWLVPQAFGGGEGWRREPSAQEGRAMTYLSLIHGAKGIQYFMRVLPNDRPSGLRLWMECRRLAAEAAELTPALLSPLPQPAVQVSDPEVHAAAWATPDAITVLAVNATNQPRPLHLTVAGATARAAEVLFENRTVPVAGGAIDDLLDGFGSGAYRLPLTDEDPAAGVDPANLTVNPSLEQFANAGNPDGYYISGATDPGASVSVDSRLAYHGRHSVRITTPTEGGGYRLSAFPIQLEQGTRYRVSLWARSREPGAKLRLQLGGLEPGGGECQVGTDWTECVLTGTAPGDARRTSVTYWPLQAGVMWVDLVQCVPLPEE